MQTKQQMRADFALSQIQEIMKKNNNAVPDKLSTKIVGMPNMILSNGLGQSLAFLLSKKSDEEKTIFDILKNYLTEPKYVKTKQEIAPGNDFDFLKSMVDSNFGQEDYLYCQEEVLRMLEWLKRYARAFSDKK